MTSSIVKIFVVGDATSAKKAFAETEVAAAKLETAFFKLGAVATAGAIGVVAAGVVAYTKFDKKMTESLAVFDDVNAGMRTAAENTARTMSKESTFSATELAAAYRDLGSTGYTVEQAIAALPQVTKFAQAGLFDLATATDLATDAQTALGLDSKDANKNLEGLTRVTDVLVAADNAASASTQEFSLALTEKAGSALKLMNKDVEEGVAVLMAFADRGVKGTVAGEALAIVMRDVSRAASNFNTNPFTGTSSGAEMQKLGIEIFDAAGNMKNMADVVDEFTDALGGMSEKERGAAFQTMGLTRTAGDQMKVLMGSGDTIREYESYLKSMGGVTQEVAEKQLQSFGARVSILKNKLVDLGMTIGEKVVPVLDAMVGFMNNNTEVVVALAAVIGGVLVAAMVAWLVQQALALGAMALQAVKLLISIAQWVAYGAAIVTVTAVSLAYTAVQWALNAAMSANPIGLLVVAIAALVAGVIYAYTHFDWFRTAVDAVWDALMWVFNWAKDNWPTLLAILTGPFGVAVLLITKNWDTIKEGATGAWNWIRDRFNDVVNFISGIPGRIGSLASGMFDGIKNAFRSAINWIIGGWNSLSFRIPGFKIGPIGYDGFNLGVPRIPYLAQGGIVMGPTLAMIGEAGPEAVVPLNRGGGTPGFGGNTYNITLNVPPGTNMRRAGREFRRYLNESDRAGIR